MGAFQNLAGLRFGRLVVLERLPGGPRGHSKWKVRCDCGVEQEAYGYKMVHGFKVSCGCALRERITASPTNKTHGMSDTKLFKTWCDMRRRCNDDRRADYDRYGGRGISVCERWQQFENFYADMGPKPPGTTLDRIDNDGNYEPGNCRWATAKEQARNKRTTRMETAFGRTQSIGAWAEELGLTYRQLGAALRWQTLKEFLSSPISRKTSLRGRIKSVSS